MRLRSLRSLTLRRTFDLASRAWDIARAHAIAAMPVRRGSHHGLDAPLILSLTSYPPRFPTLHLTLRTLLNQSISPDRLILWIADADMRRVPTRVLEMKGVEVRACRDSRSLKKLLPAYEQFPDHYIVTADDDVAYARDWLQGLVRSAQPGTRDVVAHCVRRIAVAGSKLEPIAKWTMDARDPAALLPSSDLFAVGVQGVLYPPKSLHHDIGQVEQFLEICPTCDDSWIAWMAHRAGTKVRRSASPRRKFFAWMGTNEGSLSAVNFTADDEGLRQDAIFERLSKKFGPLHRLNQGSGTAPSAPPDLARR